MTSRVERVNGWADSTRHVVTHWFTGAIDTVEECFAGASILVADGVVAWLAAENMVTALGMSLPLAIGTGIALEGAGLVTSRAALKVRYYNQTRPSGEPAMLEWLAWTGLVLQFVIGLLLVVVNTVAVNARLWGLIPIATLSAIGTVAHLLENDVKARETGTKSAIPAASVAPAAPVANVEVTLEAETVTPELTSMERVLNYYREFPTAKQEAVAKACGISRGRVGQLLAEAKEKNLIRSNGHVEVLASGEAR